MVIMAKKKSVFAKKLIALRNRLELTQVEAAERLGVAARTWIAWENNQTKPGRLAMALLRKTFPDEKF